MGHRGECVPYGDCSEVFVAAVLGAFLFLCILPDMISDSILLCKYTLFANASRFGSPPVRALWFEFPDEPELFAVDRQYLVGRDILVTPVLEPNVSTVDGRSCSFL